MMDILDWILVGALALVFLMVLFYTFKDIMKDRWLYVKRSRNVTSIQAKMRQNNVPKR